MGGGVVGGGVMGVDVMGDGGRLTSVMGGGVIKFSVQSV